MKLSSLIENYAFRHLTEKQVQTAFLSHQILYFMFGFTILISHSEVSVFIMTWRPVEHVLSFLSKHETKNTNYMFIKKNPPAALFG